MPEKIITLNHKVCDYTCMWNGIEDLYANKTGEMVPDYLFFCLSGIGNFVYLKSSNGLRRMVSWNDGRTKSMYKSINNLVGFTYKHIEGCKFSYALNKAKQQIDYGLPVVLGCLDMYYLSYYPKFFLKAHIPIHYILMAGYNDEEECVYVYDCGLEELQKLPYDMLEKAMNIERTSLSDKNAICCVKLSDGTEGIKEITVKGFHNKALQNLNSKTMGISGMRRLASEFAGWKDELSQAEYEEALRTLVMFTGTVPSLPNVLTSNGQPDGIMYQALREKYSVLLEQLGKKYAFNSWVRAGGLFKESGVLIEQMTDLMVSYLLKKRVALNEVPDIIRQIADLEEAAYKQLLS